MSVQSYQVGSESQDNKPGPMRVDAQGNVSKIAPTILTDEKNFTPGPTTLDVNDRKMAVTIRNGEISVEHRPTGSYQMGKSDSSDPLDNGRDPKFGRLLARHELKPDSIIKLHGIEGDLGGFERMGLIEKGPDGQYRIAEQKAQQEQQQQSEPMEKISEGAEGFLSFAATKLGPTAMYGTMLAMMDGRTPNNIGEIASRLNREPAQVAQNIERLKSEFTAQARRALNMDEDTFAEFSEWAHSTNKNAVRDAMIAQVDNGNLKPLKALGQKFLSSGRAYDDDSLLAAEVPQGARIYRDTYTGQIMVSYNGKTNALRGLIASGEARVSRKR